MEDLQQSTGKVSDLTYSLSGAASKVSSGGGGGGGGTTWRNFVYL